MKTNDKEIEFEFELPGFDREDIDVKLSSDSLVIKANKKSKNKSQKDDFYHVEKSARRFSYKTSLPKINSKKAKIDYKNGLLKIKAPKI